MALKSSLLPLRGLFMSVLIEFVIFFLFAFRSLAGLLRHAFIFHFGIRSFFLLSIRLLAVVALGVFPL